jgi:DNA repair protein RadC
MRVKCLKGHEVATAFAPNALPVLRLSLNSSGMADDGEAGGHHGEGHRARLRRRIFEGRGESLHDHEIVEYLLALVIPRRDTKPIAKDLLGRYGGLSGLLSADAESIIREKWMGETSVAALKVVQIAALRLLSEPVREQPVLASWQALLDYLRADMAHLTIERVRTLYLNSKNMLIRDEVASEGSVDQAAIYTREVVRRALDLGAAAIILVHNHPSGDSAPSRQDIAMTGDIIAAAKVFGISVHDHIIVGKDGFSSMRSAGLI